MATGNRDFVSGSLVDVLEKKLKPDHGKPRIFSPFGLVFLILQSAILYLRQQNRPARQLRYLTSSAIPPMVKKMQAFRNSNASTSSAEHSRCSKIQDRSFSLGNSERPD